MTERYDLTQVHSSAAPFPSVKLSQVAVHIGGRIRQRRTELGMTQDQVGRALGVSYQQIQKYETAANRISASRLFQLAGELGVDVAYFYEGMASSPHNCDDSALPHGGRNRSAIELVRNYLALSDEDVRNAVAALLKVLKERH